MQLPSKKRILLCLWTLPLAGVLAILSLLLRRYVVLPGEDLAEWAQTVVSSRFILAQYLYIVAYVIAFFGFWALYMVLMQRRVERLAFWGFMGTILGTGLPLTTLGLVGYASPALGRLYLQGDTHLPQVITNIAMGSSMVMGLPGAFFYVGGCILLGVAVWKSGASAKWTGAIFALHGLLVSFGFGSSLLLTLSWICLIVSGFGFIQGVQKETA